MIKHLILITLTLWVMGNIYAQDKSFTLDDVIPGGKNYKSFEPSNLKNIKWIDDSNSYSYTENQQIIVVNAKTAKSSTFLSLKEINKLAKDSLTTIPTYQWLPNNQLLLNLKNKKVVISSNSKKLQYAIEYPENAENLEFDPSHTRLAYTYDNNLCIANKSQKKISVTSDSNPEIKNGQSYHRNEFGIKKGIFWSPKGNYLAFVKKDESMVKDYPLMNIENNETTIENIKYPMAGMSSHEVTVGIYNPANLKLVYLNTGTPKDQYLTNITWSPNESIIYIAVLNREQNILKMNAYSLSTGNIIKTLFLEESSTYVEPENPIVFVPQHENLFVWQSERSGHNHLYLYNTDGNLLNQLTFGNWDVTNFLGFDESGEYIYYSSTEKSPIERHTYKLKIKTQEKECLTQEKGTHNVQISKTSDYAIDNWSNTETPRKIDLIDLEKNTKNNLLTAANPYTDYQLGETKIFTIKATDNNTDLYCRMITPPNYDPAVKYPVIVYVYGGPHAQLVHNKWMAGARMWQHYMAQKGYIAFTLDNRGSDGRGKTFEEVIHRQLGKVEMEDQMKGIEYLKSLPYVDAERIGVHGWSYGGFMTTSLMTTYPETFKVGVAGGPVIDWNYYEIMYGERYMDTPQENPEGYKNSNLLNKVNNLKGRLLMIHGVIDPTVVWQHSLKFVQECVTHDVQIDYFVYPRHEHNVRGKDRIHLMEKVSRYFDDFL